MNIFKYNKEGLLVEYVSFNKSGNVDIHISLQGDTMIKKIRESSNSKDLHYEYIIFKEKGQLISERYVGEYWVRAVKTNPNHPNCHPGQIIIPAKDFKLAFSKKELIGFTVKDDIINSWSNKLKGK